MKIHYLVTTLETGGAEFAIPDIVTTLQDLGHEVKIYVCEPRDMGAAPRLKAAGLSWCLLSNRRRSVPVLVVGGRVLDNGAADLWAFRLSVLNIAPA